MGNIGFGFAVGSNSMAANLIHPIVAYLLPWYYDSFDRFLSYRVFSFNFHLMTRLLFTPFMHAMMNYQPDVLQKFIIQFSGFVVNISYLYQYATDKKLRYDNTLGQIAYNVFLQILLMILIKKSHKLLLRNN